MHKRACFWKPFGSEPVDESQKLLKSAEKYLYGNFPSFSAKLSEKKLFLIGCEILGLLYNTLPRNYQYSRINRENLPLLIQIKLSKKPEIFCCIFFEFLDTLLNFQYFEKSTSLTGQLFLKLMIPRYVLIYMNKSACFSMLLRSERVNESQKLSKSLERYFYPTFSSFWSKLS